MNIGRMLERLMAMDEATWARHANPWSGWTRVTILPMFALAVWSRVWLGWWALAAIALVVAWTWINPRLFGPPASTDNWMSRGVLGERIWLDRKKRPIPAHHDRVTRLLNVAAALGFLVMVVGLVQLEAWMTVSGILAAMGAKLWFLDRMVWLKADTERAPDEN